MRQREPDAWFRIVHRSDDTTTAPPEPAPRALPSLTNTEERPRTGIRERPRPAGTGAARVAGLLGLAGLLALVLAAGLGAFGPAEPLSRSALVAGDSGAAGETPALPDPFAGAAGVPAALAGRWSPPGADCAAGEVRFLPGHELRTAADGGRRALAVDGYRQEDGGAVQIAYAGGATVTYASAPARLVIRRARIAGIEIAPQRALELVRCSGPTVPLPAGTTMVLAQLPDTPQAAFRLAVEAHDDLAAALAIARGLPVSAPLSATGPMPIELAVRQGRSVLVGKLAAAGGDPNQAGAGGAPLLLLATRAQDVAVVEALLAAGADPRRRGPDGTSALEQAAALDNQLLVDILFAASR